MSRTPSSSLNSEKESQETKISDSNSDPKPNPFGSLKLSRGQLEFLERKKIRSLETLLHTYPFRYSKVENPDQWKEGEEVLFCSEIVRSENAYRAGQRTGVVRFWVDVDSHMVEVSLFFQGYNPQLPIGKTITVCGLYQGNGKVRASWTSFQPLEEGTILYPHYSLPLKTRRDTMIRIMKKALAHAGDVADRVPPRLRKKYHLPPLKQALEMVHRPTDEAHLAQGVRAMKYEEFLTFHCARLMQSVRSSKTPRRFDVGLVDQKVAELPYTLTEDQKKTLDEILDDLKKDTVMYRLVQGDVGCGKTAVAAMALYATALSGLQAALLAPTELLARQHVQTLQSHGIEAELFCASLKAREKKKVLQGLKDGSISVVVGTHSLFQPGVEFARLGLVAADEQHRFGVLQRRALIEKGEQADVLLLSATPIPRTAAHFLYGDIDLSAIHSLPPGRQPVKTKAYFTTSMKPVLDRIMQGIDLEGRQLYVVCPAIEDNENQDIPLRSAESIYQGMQQVLGSRYSIDLLHGRMKPAQKEEIMERFASGQTQILVSTTVIEVGIDVGNATMMVIYDAHRFGLSTLHQLRGRCARGKLQGECYLLSGTKNPQARDRLRQMETIHDGFELARLDLELRGPGDLLGTRQSGLPAFILGDAGKDLAMMDCCAADAAEIVDHPEDPENRNMLRAVSQFIEQSAYLD